MGYYLRGWGVRKRLVQDIPEIQETDRDPEPKSCRVLKKNQVLSFWESKVWQKKQQECEYQKIVWEGHLCDTYLEAPRVSLAINYSKQKQQLLH